MLTERPGHKPGDRVEVEAGETGLDLFRLVSAVRPRFDEPGVDGRIATRVADPQ